MKKSLFLGGLILALLLTAGMASANSSACPSVNMPSVMQLSRPSARTPFTMATTWGISRDFGERQAAPIQKRVAPDATAALACSNTFSTAISFSTSSPVS